MSSDQRIKQIRARLRAATPGPWALGNPDGLSIESERVHPGILKDDPGADPRDGWTVAENVQWPGDADLIVNARQDIEWLLADNEWLRAELGRAP